MLHIFLDFDGTLVDSSEGIHLAFAYACEQVGLQAPQLTDFCTRIGPPIQVLAREFFPDIDPERLESLRAIFRAEYDHKHYPNVKWHQGVIEGLRSIHAWKRVRLSVVTNKPTHPANVLIATAGLTDLFACIIGIDYRVVQGNGAPFISKSEALCFALNLTGTLKKRAVYVGDTPSDQRACEESNISFIAATYGFHSWLPEEIHGFSAASSFDDVVSHISRMVKT